MVSSTWLGCTTWKVGRIVAKYGAFWLKASENAFLPIGTDDALFHMSRIETMTSCYP